MSNTNDAQAFINKENPLTIKYGKVEYKLHNGMKRDYLLKNFRTCCWHEKGHKWRNDNKNGKQILTPGDYILSSDSKLFKKHRVYNSIIPEIVTAGIPTRKDSLAALCLSMPENNADLPPLILE